MPTELPYVPDKILNVSTLDQEYYPQGTYIPLPALDHWRLRKRANVFVHNAGHGGLKGRNGTAELLEALPLVQSGAKFIIRSQEHLQGPNLPNVEYRIGNHNFKDLWDEGDVFIFPEKFNGLSLPLEEAFAAGMLVMCGDRNPMNKWLPPHPLIPVKRYFRNRVSGRCHEFQEAQFDPETIAHHIDSWYGRDISSYSMEGLSFTMLRKPEIIIPQMKEFICQA